jgi:sortase A
MAQRRRGVVFWVGLGLFAAGLGLLGYVAWQFFGTNIVSERRQRETVTELREQWRTTTGPGRQQEPASASPARLGDATALIRVPRFGDDYEMPVLEGVEDDALSRGFGHFTGSAAPGRRGNFAVAAHRITHGEPLRDMPDLRPGDEVVVETRDAIHTYELDTDPEDLVVTFEDVWVVAERPRNPDPDGVQPADHPRLLTLTTCAELFHTEDRMIAFGHLVSTRPK